MWAAEKVTEGQRSAMFTVLYAFFIIPICRAVLSLKGNQLLNLVLFMPFPINSPPTHARTHLCICDLQRAILNQGQARFISLKSLSILLPRNLH